MPQKTPNSPSSLANALEETLSKNPEWKTLKNVLKDIEFDQELASVLMGVIPKLDQKTVRGFVDVLKAYVKAEQADNALLENELKELKTQYRKKIGMARKRAIETQYKKQAITQVKAKIKKI